MSNNYKQQGFTLIELMVTLVLGLIVAAAAVQVYIVSMRTGTIQASSSNLQNASVFGFQKLENNIRLANMGNSVTTINDQTISGGVVLSAQNIPGIGIHVTRSNLGAANATAPSNAGSDQLTISYRNISGRIMSDCEGEEVADGDMVIERYFVDGTGMDLHLRCDAGRVSHNGGAATGLTGGFISTSAEFIKNVDQFKILLGVQQMGTGSPMITYMPVNIYNGLSAPKPPIVSIRIAILSRGGNAILGEKGQDEFTLFGDPYKLKAGATSQVRGVYETNILLRNARVVYTTGR